MSNSDIRDLARALQPDSDLFGQMSIRKAVVTAIDYTSPPTITVQLSGDPTPISNISVFTTYSPQINDVCLLARQGNTFVAIGAVSTDGGWIQPTLLNGWSHDTPTGFGPVKYRVIYDQGQKKVQMKGAIVGSGTSNTTIFSLEPQAISSGGRSAVVARSYSVVTFPNVDNTASTTDYNLGVTLLSCRIDFNSSGAAILVGSDPGDLIANAATWVGFSDTEWFV